MCDGRCYCMAVLNANNYYLDLRKHQFIVSVCVKCMFFFFLFNFFLNMLKSMSTACTLPGDFWGSLDTIFSDTTFAQVLEQETQVTQNQ